MVMIGVHTIRFGREGRKRCFGGQELCCGRREGRLCADERKCKNWRADHGAGDEQLPVWRVRLWAERLDRPGRHVGIGEVILSAEDGEVMRRGLNIRRVG